MTLEFNDALTHGPVVLYHVQAQFPPSPPLSPAGLHQHCSSLTWPEHTCVFTELSCLIKGIHHVLLNTEPSDFFPLVQTSFKCSLVFMIKKMIADFSKCLYPVDFICCRLQMSSNLSQCRLVGVR